jgi:APA family basic amino acid/polyamine antiporter
MREAGTLRRRLGVGDAVVVGAGSMMGAGVFTAWAPAAASAGNGLLVGLVLAGIVAFCNATSSAQLAAAHPESGGTYVYARERLGASWGHLAGWGFVVGKTASCAAMALAVGAYLWPDQERLVGAAAVMAIAAVNVGGLERTVAVTRVLVVVTTATLAAVVAIAWSSDTTTTDRLTPVEGSIFDMLRAGGLLFFAFAGYARIATLGEEVRDPEVTIPKAVPRALAMVLGVYLCVGVSAVAAVGAAALAGGDAPLRTVVDVAGAEWAAPFVRVGAVIASLGGLLNHVPRVARTTRAMARRRELPGWFAHVDARRDLPLRAELTVVVVVVTLVTLVGLRSAIAVSGTAILTYYAITNAAALTLGPEQRRWPRWISAMGLVGCVTLAAALPWRELCTGGAVLIAGAGVRAAVERRRRGPSPA